MAAVSWQKRLFTLILYTQKAFTNKSYSMRVSGWHMDKSTSESSRFVPIFAEPLWRQRNDGNMCLERSSTTSAVLAVLGPVPIAHTSCSNRFPVIPYLPGKWLGAMSFGNRAAGGGSTEQAVMYTMIMIHNIRLSRNFRE